MVVRVEAEWAAAATEGEERVEVVRVAVVWAAVARVEAEWVVTVVVVASKVDHGGLVATAAVRVAVG